MEKKVIFNVGRQFGSGGKCVATEIGRILDIPVYDNELIAKAAEMSGVGPEFFKRSDEKKRFLSLGDGGGICDTELFRIQSETIRDIASKGSAVFVGRASDYVLRDMNCCVDIFITASLEARISRVSERLALDRKEAEALIRKKDTGREEYYNFFTFARWGVASNYDLCIDSGVLGIEKTAELVIDFARKALQF